MVDGGWYTRNNRPPSVSFTGKNNTFTGSTIHHPLYTIHHQAGSLQSNHLIIRFQLIQVIPDPVAVGIGYEELAIARAANPFEELVHT